MKKKGRKESLIPLSPDEVKWIYEEHMTKDFPAAERKPLSRIFAMQEEGIYETFGLWSEGELRGYAFFVCVEELVLLDYFAIFSSFRQQGWGGRMLSAITVFFADRSGIVLESENPEEVEGEEEKETARSRLDFYQRNSAKDTGLRAKVFGVGYRLLYLTARQEINNELPEKIDLLYHRMFPGELYSKGVEKQRWKISRE